MKIDVSDLSDAGADLSNAEIVANDEDNNIAYSNFDNEAEEVQLVLDTSSTGSDTVNLGTQTNDQLELQGIDTSGVTTANELEYTVRMAGANPGDFDSNFQTTQIDSVGPFSIATVEVENLDTGTTITEASLTEAISEANDPTSDDLSDGSTGDQVEIRPNEGTYTFDSSDITDANTRITPLGDSDVTFENGNSGYTLTADAENVEIEDITFDQSDNAQTAVVLDDSGSESLTLSNVTFENGDDDGNSAYITADDGADLTIEDSSLTDGGDTTANDGISLSNDGGGGEFTVSNTEFDALGTAIDLDVSVDTTLSVTDNTFGDNNIHVADATGNEDLNAIFQSNGNTFDKYAVPIDDNNGDVVRSSNNELVGDLDAAGGTGDFENGATTILVAGSHDGASTINLGGSSDVTLTADSANASIVVDTTVLNTGSGASSVTVDGLVFEEIGSNTPITTSGTTTDLSITNNEFLGAGDGTTSTYTVADLATVNGLTITDNLFESEVDNNNNYDAVDIDTLQGDSSAVSVDISNNEIVNAESGILVGEIADNGDGVELTVEDNTITIEDNPESNPSPSFLDGQKERGIEIISAGSSSSSVVEVTGNEINTSSFSGPDPNFHTGVALSDGGSDEFSATVSQNSINGFSAAIDVSDVSSYGGDDGHTSATIESNELTNNGYHIRALASDFDVETFRSANALDKAVLFQDGDPANSDTSLQTTAPSSADVADVYGTLSFALADARRYSSGGNTGEELGIAVGPGTYELSNQGLELGSETIHGAKTLFIRSENGAEETVFTPANDNDDIWDIDAKFANPPGTSDDRLVISGFTFDSSDAGTGTDFDLNAPFGGSATDPLTLSDNVFVGNEDRTAVSADTDTKGIVTVQDSEISGYGTGVAVSSGFGGDQVNVVRSTISDSTTGIDVGSDGAVVANFNDIVNNNVGIDTADTTNDDVTALANYYGSASGPNVTTDATESASLLVNDAANVDADPGLETLPYRDASISELDMDAGKYTVVTDARNPTADDPNGAEVLVAVLNDTVAADAEVGEGATTLTANGPNSLTNIGEEETDSVAGPEGGVTAPIRIGYIANGDSKALTPSNSESGDYTLTAVNTNDEPVSTGSSVQTFSAPIDGVDVTVDNDQLVADGTTTANATLQLVDADGNAVSRSGVGVTWSVTNGASDAGASRTGDIEDGETDANGQAQLSVSADTAGESFDVVGIANDNSGSVTINTVEPAAANFTVDFVEGPTEIVQNESFSATVNVTNEGDAAGTQDITYNLEDSTGISQVSATEEDVQLNASASQEVTFEVAASDTESLSTGNFTHVFSSNDDELTLNVTVQDEPASDPVERFDTNGEPGIQDDEVLNAISAFNEGEEGVEDGDVLDVISAFNEA
ncbi:hypothetical protein DP107_17925 [Haloglomus irregulare]|uniref:Uncharacterized protein n=1 Tax=Haloglomus irregulare TaxID=2234134 RepID=A0A554MUS1_9EURY|nr:hypothetical protein DP107_17925 [Haloglomus irregulare]